MPISDYGDLPIKRRPKVGPWRYKKYSKSYKQEREIIDIIIKDYDRQIDYFIKKWERFDSEKRNWIQRQYDELIGKNR